jgi:hypothetical protein
VVCFCANCILFVNFCGYFCLYFFIVVEEELLESFLVFEIFELSLIVINLHRS